MRILFFTDHFYPEPSAPAAHVFERAKLWVRWGHDVTVLCAAPNFPEGKVFPGYENRWRSVSLVEGIRVVRVKTLIFPNQGFFLRTLDYLSYMISSFFWAFFESKPEVVISTSPHLFVPMSGLAFSKLRRVPHVFEVRDLWPDSILAVTPMERGWLYRALEVIETVLYRSSNRILSFTESFVDHFLDRGVDRGKIDVVINGANLELFHPLEKDTEIEKRYGLEGRFVIGYLGTLGLAHGLENVLEAAALLRDSDIVFFFVGVGAAKAELERITDSRSLDNVVFAPRQEKSDMPRFLSVCDVSLVHLRDAEVFGKVVPSKIFEAMAMGLPVLYVGPEGEGPELVRKHDVGVCLPPGDPELLAREAGGLEADSERLSRLARNSLASAPRFSRERQARDTLESLRRAMASDTSPSTEGA